MVKKLAKKSDTKEQRTIRELSDQIVTAQKPIRILDAIKWSETIKKQFFKDKGKKLPKITHEYYHDAPLSFDPKESIENFLTIERAVQRKLGQFNPIANIMIRMCREYRTTIHLLQARGTPNFTLISQDLYGSAYDAFYLNGPSLSDLAKNLSTTLSNLDDHVTSVMDEKNFDSKAAVAFLKKRLSTYFHLPDEQLTIKTDDGIIADAAAGADVIKLRKEATFSERDLLMLEVHEGWVHIGTTFNGRSQPYCTFLSKGTPSSTIFQEGLAVIVEIFSFVSHPDRIKKLANRIHAIQMAEDGADFLEVYQFFLSQKHSPDDCYNLAVRIFRGSTPTKGPFTKDLAYSKGFILIYNFIRLAIAQGKTNLIPLLFLGKTNLEDLRVYAELLDEGTVVAPRYLPPYFRDLAALSCWMAYSLFLNKLELDKLYHDFKTIL
jgi:uncharacterized protein (TIGR02421 family)